MSIAIRNPAFLASYGDTCSKNPLYRYMTSIRRPSKQPEEIVDASLVKSLNVLTNIDPRNTLIVDFSTNKISRNPKQLFFDKLELPQNILQLVTKYVNKQANPKFVARLKKSLKFSPPRTSRFDAYYALWNKSDVFEDMFYHIFSGSYGAVFRYKDSAVKVIVNSATDRPELKIPWLIAQRVSKQHLLFTMVPRYYYLNTDISGLIAYYSLFHMSLAGVFMLNERNYTEILPEDITSYATSEELQRTIKSYKESNYEFIAVMVKYVVVSVLEELGYKPPNINIFNNFFAFSRLIAYAQNHSVDFSKIDIIIFDLGFAGAHKTRISTSDVSSSQHRLSLTLGEPILFGRGLVILLLETIYTLFHLNTAFEGMFMHYDLKLDNILVFSYDREIIIEIKEHRFLIPNVGYVFKIGDFDFTNLGSIYSNSKCQKFTYPEFQFISNPMYDLFFLMRSIDCYFPALRKTNKRFASFYDLIIRDKEESKTHNWRLLKYYDLDYEQVISHALFDEFRVISRK